MGNVETWIWKSEPGKGRENGNLFKRRISTNEKARKAREKTTSHGLQREKEHKVVRTKREEMRELDAAGTAQKEGVGANSGQSAWHRQIQDVSNLPPKPV